MVETNNGESRSSDQTEQSAPNGTSTHSGEKKVSLEINLSTRPRKRYMLVECDEDPDGSLAHCNLIPLDERKSTNLAVGREQRVIAAPTETPSDAVLEGPCTSRKCKIPSSFRKKMIRETTLPTDDDK